MRRHEAYLVIGDLHGNLRAARAAIEFAAQHAALILQVGDWGFLEGNPEATWRDRTPQLCDLLVEHDVTMRFIDGNHDVHPELRRQPLDEAGAAPIGPNLYYQPRGSCYDDGELRIAFLGGAPSIDRLYRTAGQEWWPEEEITEGEAARAAALTDIDLLITHDAPALPPGFSQEGIEPAFAAKAARSTGLVRQVLEALQPAIHCHGHYHRPYYRDDLTVRRTKIYGLGSDANLFDLWKLIR